MNDIETKILEKKLSYKGNIILSYKIEYPKITKSENDYGRIVFNNYNRSRANEIKEYAEGELFEEAKQVYDYNNKNGFPIMVFEVDRNYKVTYNKKTIISLYTNEYIYNGGAHGITTRESQNWDIRIGEQIELWQLYPNNPYFILDILKQINEQIEKQIANENNYFFDNYCQLLIETFNPESFYYEKNNLVIFFQSYDIAPYSSGIPIFEIPRLNNHTPS